MKKSGGNFRNIAKYFLAIVLACLAIFGFTNSKSIISNVKNYFDGDEPMGSKTKTDNMIGDQKDGTYKLSLSVTGDAEKKPTHVNVIVIVDRSNSMDTQSGTGAYVSSNSNGNNMYGFVDGEYVPLHRWNGWSGTWPNRVYHDNEYYYGWVSESNPGTRYTGQRYIYDGTATRLQATKAAVNGLASSLLGYNGVDGNADDTVEMALVQFATTAQTNVAKTTDATTFVNSVNGISTPGGQAGGTNWEAALKQANTINFGDTDPTYVIFFSDGSPTFYLNSTGGTAGTGGESEPNMKNSYDAATDDAETLATKVGVDKFYTIFAYGTTVGAGYMTDLTTAAGAPSGNNYSASNTVELEEAFAEILAKIEMAGISTVDIVDGTTNKVATQSGVSSLLNVDTTSFQYWKTKDGVRTEWKKTDDPAPPAATLDPATGEVKWDLSSLGVLENDVTYEVTFDVYPSQETYDLIADIKNKKTVFERQQFYNNLDENIKKYLKPTDETYTDFTLATNTVKANGESTATISYIDTRETNPQPHTFTYTNPQPVGTTASTISIHKEWKNDIPGDPRIGSDIEVNLQRDGVDFYPTTLTSPDFSASNIFIATGLARLTDGELKVLDVGHDYKFAELGSEAYNWELDTETVHPMLINNVLTKLVLLDNSEIPSGMGNKTFYEEGENKYYKLANGNTYIDAGTDPQIKAINNRRSNLNITKTVNTSSQQSTELNDKFSFTINVDMKDEKGKSIVSEDDTHHNDYLWFSVAPVGSTDPIALDEVPTNWQKEDGANYYYAPNGTSLVIEIPAGYNIRFTNLPTNTTFDITEGDLTNYVLESLVETSEYKDETTGNVVTENIQKVEGSKKISGTITENNRSYTVEATNRYEKVDIEVEKDWQEDDNGSEGLRTSIEVALKANGTQVDTCTLSESTNWKCSFTKNRFQNEREITYTIEELTDLTPHYITTYDGFKIINTRNSDDVTTKASVFKVWDDDRNHDGFRPTSLQVQLNDEDETIVTLNSGNEWKATVEDLPKYAGGQEITYSWTELNLPSQYTQQTPVVTNIEEDGKVVGKLTTITNKHTPVYINIPVEKVWLKDDNGSEGLRTAVTVKLLKGTETIGTKTLTKDNNWKGVFEHVAKYEDGEEIEYALEEVKVNHYTTDITFDEDTGSFTVTNTREDDKTIDIPVEKIWVGDNNDEQGLRTPITVTLKKGNTTVGTKTLSASNNWKDKFTDLPKYENGDEIEYTLTENYTNTHYEIGEVQGSTKNGFTITNVRDDDDITIDYSGKKIWNDKNDQDGLRPDSITITLTGTIKERDNDGNLTDVDRVVFDEDITVNRPEGAATSEWTFSREKLQKYADGQLITYTISEDQVDEYDEPVVDGNEVTNPHTPFETSVKIIKKWDDKNNQDGLRQPVKFKLTNENGLMIPDAMAGTGTSYTLTDEQVDSDGNWYVNVEKLPRRAAGAEIEYSVIEISRPEGYTPKDNDPEVTPSKTDEQTGGQEFTILYTNIHETETVDVSGVKEWNDDSNRDVVRPQSIYITLTGTVDGEVVFGPETKLVTSATAVDGNPNQWAYSFTGLDEYYNGGKTITYTITETDENGNEIEKLPNYEAPEYFGDYSVRNTHTNEPTSLSGKKVWADDGNRDAVRPTTITVEVYDVDDPNTIVASKEVTGSMTGAEWSYEFTGLNKNKNVNGTKTPITYEVKEVNVPDGYTSKVEEDGTTITNTYTPEKTQISGKKVWVDDGNRDALRPTTITVEVYDVDDSNTVVASKEVSGDMTADEWSYTITGLPANKNVNGKATSITYKVKEVVVPTGYTSKVEEDGTTITNTHETSKINVPVSKTWIDSDDKEKHRPTEITVYLYDDKDVKVGETKLNAENGWEYTFENLPANRNVNGVATPITYRAEEVITDQIREFYDVDVVENTAIINTIKDLSKDIPVAKIWNDANNQDGKRKPVTITLSGTISDKDGNVINVETDKVPKTITLTEEDLDPNDSNRWAGVFENVPIFYQGSWITYQITEADVADYSVTAYGTEDDGTLTVTNTHEPEQAVYSASKVWNDDDDNDDRRPDSVTFALMANGSEVQRLVASEENGWKVTFAAVPVYKEGAVGQKITYTVTEPELDSNYTMSEDIATGKTEYDFIITNDHEPMTITYNVHKIWDDWDNQSGDRPESITVRIYESTDLENEVASQVITEASGWNCSFEGLPKYRNKQLIQYVIAEDNVDLYKEPIITQVEQERDTTELNNTVTNPKDRVPYNDTGEITVNKYWKDEENKYKKRPKSVTIELLADGEVIATADLTEANDWTYTFTGLWKYKEGEVGVEIVYSIRELAVEYYKTTIDGFDVYNTYDGPVPEITPPNTGVMMVKDNNNNVLFEMIATVLATSYTIVVARRRNEQE